MERAEAGTLRTALCPDCESEVEPGGLVSEACHEDGLVCPRCGAAVDGGGRRPHLGVSTPQGSSAAKAKSMAVGGLGLAWRNLVLRLIEQMYWCGTCFLSLGILACGGFVPVVRAWLRNQINDWPDVVASLGGLWFRVETLDPDSDLGPVLGRVDAPQLFATIEAVGRRLGVKPPGQVRLTYLPCCGVVAWGRSRALIIGLPLFRVLTQCELRAVIAHELAHLARGDATRAARSARFVEAMELAFEREGHRLRGPLGVWARFCLDECSRLIEPVARSQETRADRSSALVAGGSAASSALVKVAVVQPLFRELLEAYDPSKADGQNLYAFFREFWYRLPSEVHSAMRLSVLARRDHHADPAHPPLPDRVAALQSYPDRAVHNGDLQPATTFLGDPEIFEQMLHNRLFALPAVEPSIFHRACS